METLRDAKTVVVYEGLPHQVKEATLLKQELKREDIRRLGGFPFYTPALDANVVQTRQLKKILCDGDLYFHRAVPTDCGPFHPDFAVEWQDDKITRHALFCFGCDEVQILSEGTVFEYHLKKATRLRTVFSEFSLKRPVE